MNPYFYSFW